VNSDDALWRKMRGAAVVAAWALGSYALLSAVLRDPASDFALALVTSDAAPFYGKYAAVAIGVSFLIGAALLIAELARQRTDRGAL